MTTKPERAEAVADVLRNLTEELEAEAYQKMDSDNIGVKAKAEKRFEAYHDLKIALAEFRMRCE